MRIDLVCVICGVAAVAAGGLTGPIAVATGLLAWRRVRAGDTTVSRKLVVAGVAAGVYGTVSWTVVALVVLKAFGVL